MPIRMLGPKGGELGLPHRLEKGTSENTRPQRGVDCEIPRWLKRKMKALRKSPKRKAQREQNMLTVDLDRYKINKQDNYVSLICISRVSIRSSL